MGTGTAGSRGTPGTFIDYLVRGAIEKAERERQRIREHLDYAAEEELRPLLERADRYLDDVRLRAPPSWAGANTRSGRSTARSSCPEVFGRANPGLDAIVGNAPFAGKNNIITAHRNGYLVWLKAIHEGAHGNADLVAHFYRRAFGLLRRSGCFGLLATNTIRRGDTRATGLRPIRQAGGMIYSATRRRKWPGEAAVVVCVVHVCKGHLERPYVQDEAAVPSIGKRGHACALKGDSKWLSLNLSID